MSKFNLCNITYKLSIDDEDRVYYSVAGYYYSYIIKLIAAYVTQDNKVRLVLEEYIKCNGSYVYRSNMYSDDDIPNMSLVASRNNFTYDIDLDTVIDKQYLRVYANDLQYAINEDNFDDDAFFDEWYIEREEGNECIGLDCVEGIHYYRIIKDICTQLKQNNNLLFSAKVYIDTDVNEK